MEIHYGENADKLITKLYHERIELLKKKKTATNMKSDRCLIRYLYIMHLISTQFNEGG